MLCSDIVLSPAGQISDCVSILFICGKTITGIEGRTVMKVIVIGASHAGIAFVDAMRRHGFDGSLTMIDRLAGLPLERPPGFNEFSCIGGQSTLYRMAAACAVLRSCVPLASVPAGDASDR